MQHASVLYLQVEAFVAEEHIHVCTVAGNIAVNATTQGQCMSQRVHAILYLNCTCHVSILHHTSYESCSVQLSCNWLTLSFQFALP